MYGIHRLHEQHERVWWSLIFITAVMIAVWAWSLH